MLEELRADLKKLANPQKAIILSRFFKTGKGEYGEGDIFLGVTVPQSREIASKYYDIPYSELELLLKSKVHEERLVALVILTHKFKKIDKKEAFDFYLSHTKYVNNWDLVDLSAPTIVGGYLQDKPRNVLYSLSKSKDLWERRIAIVSTYEFISKDKDSEWTFKIAEILIPDRHDLIEKATGWMLREVGKRISEKVERRFLDKHYKNMGRTALRYAIERFDPEIRVKYLKGNI